VTNDARAMERAVAQECLVLRKGEHIHPMKRCVVIFIALAMIFASGLRLEGADHLRLNPSLNFRKNGHQGQLIFGEHLQDGLQAGKVNYIVFYAEFCYNAKRQARRTVDLYDKFQPRVHFVIVDFEYGWSAAQNVLVNKYFSGNIPQIVILDSKGRPVFNYIGEARETTLQAWLKAALTYPQELAEVDHPMDHPGKTATREITHNPFEILRERLGGRNTSY
jgi:hypothetical protein